MAVATAAPRRTRGEVHEIQKFPPPALRHAETQLAAQPGVGHCKLGAQVMLANEGGTQQLAPVSDLIYQRATIYCSNLFIKIYIRLCRVHTILSMQLGRFSFDLTLFGSAHGPHIS